MVEVIPRAREQSWAGRQEAKANCCHRSLGAAWVLLLLFVYFSRGTRSSSIRSCKINFGFMQVFFVPKAVAVGGRVFPNFCGGLQG